jgi:hypothetical protein
LKTVCKNNFRSSVRVRTTCNLTIDMLYHIFVCQDNA